MHQPEITTQVISKWLKASSPKLSLTCLPPSTCPPGYYQTAGKGSVRKKLGQKAKDERAFDHIFRALQIATAAWEKHPGSKYFTLLGRPKYQAIARDLFKVESLPDGALPFYSADSP